MRLSGPVGNGTAFTINVEDRQYLVTARHLLHPHGPTPARVSNRFGAHDIDFSPLDGVQAKADVAVTALPKPLTADLPLAPTMKGAAFSQDVFFLGFPYGMALQLAHAGPDPTIAFVKKGILSAQGAVEGVDLLYIDALNNPGFSGGPVIG